MEIKEVYLDLKEWPQYAKKNKSVFKLESEAFKEPLKFKFVYDDSDLHSLREQVKTLESKLSSKEKDIDFLMKSVEKLTFELKWLNNRFVSHWEDHTLIDVAFDEIRKEQKNIKKSTTEIKAWVDVAYKKIINITDYISELDNLIASKTPLMFEQTEFIAWNGVYYYNTLDIPSGEYAVIQTTQIDESNEYVLNRDSTDYFKVRIDDKWYTPFYRLIPKTNLDNPTAKVKLTILFFPM